jgi:hypothetical protein
MGWSWLVLSGSIGEMDETDARNKMDQIEEILYVTNMTLVGY